MQQNRSPEGQTTMAAIDVVWTITITSESVVMGSPIQTNAWDILSKLAAIKARIPAGWQADAYPQV